MSDARFLQEGFEKQLAHVVEECGEVLAAAGKTQRWGQSSVNPLLKPGDPLYGETNSEWLFRELADLEQAIARLRTTVRDSVPVRAPTCGLKVVKTWDSDLRSEVLGHCARPRHHSGECSVHPDNTSA